MKDNNIVDKIRKLLELSKSSDYDNESYVALQKAQELMVKYKLSESDVTEEDIKKQVCVHKETPFSFSTRSSDHYISSLANLIAENFCCLSYITTPGGTRTHTICFIGMEDDVAICIEAMAIANRTIIKGYNKVYKELAKALARDYVPAQIFNPYKNGYIRGYLKGLESALNKQKEEHPEYALVLRAPAEAQTYIDSLSNLNLVDNTGINTHFYDTGYADGASFKLGTKISMRDTKNIE